MLSVLMFLVLAIGIVDSFLTYFRILKKYSGQDNFIIGHVIGTIIAFLRFSLYFLVAAVILYFVNG